MKLSVVIPVYNEGAATVEVVRRVRESISRQGIEAEIIVVNDGSTDDGPERIRQIPEIVFLDRKVNMGKGAAVKAGFQAASGDVLLIQDADLEYNPDDYSLLLAPIADGRCQVVIGSRFINAKLKFFGKNKSPYFTHYVGNKTIVWLTNLLYGNKATDYEGCYKAFSREVVRAIPIRSNGFEYDNEIICKALKRGYRVHEVPIEYTPRTYDAGKKITWRHGVRMVWAILRFRFLD